MNPLYSPDPLGQALLEASKVLLDNCDLLAHKELKQHGFKVATDADMHWADILFSTPKIDWVQAGKIILLIFDHVSEAIAKAAPLPDGQELTELCEAKFPAYFTRIGKNCSEFIYQYMNTPVTPELTLLSDFVPSIIPNYMASHLSGDLEQIRPADVEANIKILRPFFAILKKIAENLPENFEEVLDSIKTEILGMKSVLINYEHSDGLWIKMIYFGMTVNLYSQTFNDYQEICSDRKSAPAVYGMYKALYLNQRDNNYFDARERIDCVLDLKPSEQKRLWDMLQLANGSAVELFDFQLANPKYHPLLERIVRLNTDQYIKQEALSAFVEYFSQDNLVFQDLILSVATDNKKFVAILNREILNYLEAIEPSFCKTLQDFLSISKDPELYLPVLTALLNEDAPRAKIMIAGVSLINTPNTSTNHQKRVQFVTNIAALPEEELPTKLDETYVQQLTSNKPTTPNNHKQAEATLPKFKRQQTTFDNQRLQQSYEKFQIFRSGRLFIELVKECGAESEVIQTTTMQLQEKLDNNFYRIFLNDPLLRRLYFKTILPNQEFRQEFQERLELSKIQNGNPKLEAELFRKWINSKLEELKNPPTLVSEFEDLEIQPAKFTTLTIGNYTYRTPPAFKKIVILAPTEKVRLNLTKILEAIPSLPADSIQIMNAENRIPVLGTARHLSSDRLILLMTSNCSHSTYLSLLANIPEGLRNNLYNFNGISNLYSLLGFLNFWNEEFNKIQANKI